ncbi:hypothetical protein KEM54_002769 [Ascosphaera aggregata]|nr:hypothetical protein KEM54_002769 [Ascosphaera aggregata]
MLFLFRREAVADLLEYLENRSEIDFYSGGPLAALTTLVYSDNVNLQRSASLTFAEITERGVHEVGRETLEPILFLLQSNMEKQSASGILFTCLRIMRRDLDYRKSDKQRELIGTHVKSLMIDYLDTHKVLDETQPTLTILTLSNSSTTLAGLLAGLDLQYQVPTTTRKTYIRFNVRIAESRPLCEGASLAKMLVERAEELGFADRLNIEIASDSSMAHLARGANFVFLGADRVSQRGAVLNKMGSYPLALCAKIVTCGKAKVAAIFERDKITTPNDTADVNEDNDWNELIASWSIKDQSICDKHLNIECRNIYFEWVPPKYIDYYVCDAGLLPKSDIKAEALWKAKVRKQVFSDMNW